MLELLFAVGAIATLIKCLRNSDKLNDECGRLIQDGRNFLEKGHIRE